MSRDRMTVCVCTWTAYFVDIARVNLFRDIEQIIVCVC